MGMFDEFNKKLSKNEREAIDEAAKNQNNYKEVPAGSYVGEIEKMELGATKDGRPMFKIQFRITEGDFKKSCIFMNRVVAGTKNDANMIASVEGWINKLEPNSPLKFNGNYDEFNDDIMDIMEEINGAIELEVDYDADKFNSITITNIYDK